MELTSTTRTVVPARECRIVTAHRGDSVSVVDLEGGQVGDVFVFAVEDPLETHSAAHTRAHVSRLFPRVGEQFLTDRRRPVLELAADTSPGRHDMLIAACDPERYALLGAGGHASCAGGLRRGMAEHGLPLAAVPQPINVFMDIPVDAGGRLSWLPAPSRAGDSITFKVLIDCHVALSACPQDLNPINGAEPTSLALDVHPTRFDLMETR